MSTLTLSNKGFIVLTVSLLTLKVICMDVCPVLEIALIIEIT